MDLKLCDLPLEILEGICQMLCPHCLGATDKNGREHSSINKRLLGDLSHVSQACSLLRSIAQPILHHSPLVGSSMSFALTRTLCQNSELGKAVRELRAGSEMYSQRNFIITPDESAYLTDRLSEYSDTDGHPIYVQPKWWIESHHHDPWGRDKVFRRHPSLALSALTMAQTPNISYLNLSVAWERSNHLPFTLPGSLPRLKELILEYTGRHLSTIGFEGIAAVFLQAATTLQSFTAKNWVVMKIPSICLPENLVEIHLLRSRIATGTLGMLLSKAKNLQAFSYVPSADFLDDYEDARPKGLFEALLTRADTLRRVRIDLSEAIDVSERCGHNEELYCMESISAMQVLESLSVDMKCIRIGPQEGHYPKNTIARLLPASIRCLTIAHNDNLDEAFIHLASISKSNFPFLREVHLQDLRPSPSGDALFEAFKFAGLRLVGSSM